MAGRWDQLVCKTRESDLLIKSLFKNDGTRQFLSVLGLIELFVYFGES